MRTRPILLFTTALLFAACGRRNNLLLGRVESPLGTHTVAVTDCYRLSAPGPEQVDATAYHYMPCRDADVWIRAEELTVNGKSYGRLNPGDGVLVDHGGVSIGRSRRSEEHTSELQSLRHLVCRFLLEKKPQCGDFAADLPDEGQKLGADKQLDEFGVLDYGPELVAVYFLNEPATPEIYPLSLHDALPIYLRRPERRGPSRRCFRLSNPGSSSPYGDRKSTRLNSSHLGSSYAVFCFKK